MNGIKGIYGKLNYAILNRLLLIVLIVVEIIIFANLTPYFFQLDNFLPVGRQIATLGIVAIGQTLCILNGGFDLSVGGTAALSGVVVGAIASPSMLGLPYIVALPAGLLVAIIIGFINGTLITRFRVSPLITTISMSFILGGVVILITKQPITANTAAFKFLGATTLGSINFPLPIVILLVLYVLFGFILKFTRTGRHLYCTGGNQKAAEVAGINTKRVMMKTYILSSLLAGVAGIILASRIATANPSIGSSYALESIAAAVLGGTILAGGEGSVFGAFLGVVLIGILSNGLIMVGAPQAFRDIATGIVLIVAVIIQMMAKKSKRFA
jgi:ribose transport system permease protein